jgi:hypothetical protein
MDNLDFIKQYAPNLSNEVTEYISTQSKDWEEYIRTTSNLQHLTKVLASNNIKLKSEHAHEIANMFTGTGYEGSAKSAIKRNFS